MANLRLFAALLGSCLLLAACGAAKRLPSTSPPGTIDPRPDPLWGPPYPDMPPELDGRPSDPTHGLGVQQFADRLIGRRIAVFVGHGWDLLRSGAEINDFCTLPRAGPGPGMCQARRFHITGGFSRDSEVVRTSEGEWLPPVYAVAGSLAPIPAGAAGYAQRLDQACRQRRDMDIWFSAEPRFADRGGTEADRAYLGARLADAVVAAARRQGALPFRLRCKPYPSHIPARPICTDDVRGTAAALAPRAILGIGNCNDSPGSDCLSVELAKAPSRSRQIALRWGLEIRFRRQDGLRIEEVELSDIELTID